MNNDLREALEPFAVMADAIGKARPNIRSDDDVVYGFEKTRLTLGDFKRARLVLSADADHQFDLERAGHDIIHLKPEEWKVIVEE